MKFKICFILSCNLLISNLLIAQNITNTLGTSGVFTIKDATNNYLTLDQSTGQVNLLNSLRLEYTTGSTTGVIFKGANRFIHNYGPNNTFLGINSGNFTMSGHSNTAVGWESLISNTGGVRNTAVGTQALYSNTTGSWNIAVGLFSLASNSTGYQNTALGTYSLVSNSTGYQNTAVGHSSLFSNTTGLWNTALGWESLYFNNGSSNTAIGFRSLSSNIDGTQNTAVGHGSLYSNSTGIENTAVGYQSLSSNTINSGNTAVGWNSLYSSTGFQNTAVGHHSLNSNTSGNFNTALGYNAGSTITTGYNLTCIGIDAAPLLPTSDNQITLGNGFVSSLRCNVTTITSLSDKRDKKNISELSLGLDFITKLKPRQFNWDKREWYDDNISDGTKMKESPTAGFIAQELDEVQTNENAEWLNLVLKDNPEKWEATPGNLLPIVVKAVQELAIKNEELTIKNEKLEERLAKYEELQGTLVKRLEQLEPGDGNYKFQIVNTEIGNQ